VTRSIALVLRLTSIRLKRRRWIRPAACAAPSATCWSLADVGTGFVRIADGRYLTGMALSSPEREWRARKSTRRHGQWGWGDDGFDGFRMTPGADASAALRWSSWLAGAPDARSGPMLARRWCAACALALRSAQAAASWLGLIYDWINERRVERLIDALRLSRASGVAIENLDGDDVEKLAAPVKTPRPKTNPIGDI